MLWKAQLPLSPSLSTGEVTFLAARVSAPAWVRRQREVRGSEPVHAGGGPGGQG